jgi:hypothetical protein
MIDRLKYWYLYLSIVVNQNIDKYFQYRENARWIRKNGPYKG